MDLAEWTAKAEEEFPNGMRVLVLDSDLPDFTAARGQIITEGDGSLWLQIWLSPYQDTRVKLDDTVEMTDRGWYVPLGGSRTLLRPLTPEQAAKEL